MLFTVGHSTRTLQALLELLHAHGVRRLLDVRRIPRSRRHPHFDRETLAERLPAVSIAYAHWPGLGGLRRPRADSTNTGLRHPAFRAYADYMQTAEFARHLDALVQQAGREPVAIMCAEALPARCHRSLIADALAARGLEVRHILGTAAAEPHRLRPESRVTGGRVTYPGEGDLFTGPAAEPSA